MSFGRIKYSRLCCSAWLVEEMFSRASARCAQLWLFFAPRKREEREPLSLTLLKLEVTWEASEPHICWNCDQQHYRGPWARRHAYPLFLQEKKKEKKNNITRILQLWSSSEKNDWMRTGRHQGVVVYKMHHPRGWIFLLLGLTLSCMYTNFSLRSFL